MSNKAESRTSHPRSALTSVPRALLLALCCLEGVALPHRPGPAVAAPAVGATFVVSNTSDSGSNSLRQAITAANASPGTDTIVFDIPGPGIQAINLMSPLPQITGPIIIDGYSQPGASPNTLADGDDAALLVEINGAGAGAGANGLIISAGGSKVRGLIITAFNFSGIVLQTGGGNLIEGNFIAGNSTRGVTVEQNSSGNFIGGTTPDARNLINGNGRQGVRILSGSTANQIQGNFIGVDRTGGAPAGNFNEGVLIFGSGNLVGGETAGARNVISASLSGSGVAMVGAAATDNTVSGNYIGTNSTGTASLGNREEGILLDQGAANNRIGGPSLADRNVISGNLQNGVVIGFTSASDGNQILTNSIGTAANGLSPLGNGQAGISLAAGSNNAIGDLSGNGNTIAFNHGAGVKVLSGINNAIFSNSIFANGGLGIDLGGDGVTPDDPGDADAGPNHLQNYPQQISTTAFFGGRLIAGALNSAANTTYTMQFFANEACDASGAGQGQQLIATRGVTTDATGSAAFSFTVPGNFSPVITATATDPAGNTSEFSACSFGVMGADLAISKTASASTVRPGDDLVYTITATNNGPSTATDVTVSDMLPDTVTFTSCAASGGGLCLGDGRARRVTFAALAPGTSSTVSLTVSVSSALKDGDVINNTATVNSPLADDLSSNNTATVSVRVVGTALALRCPGAMTLNADSGQCSVAVQYPPPALEEGEAAGISCSPPAGSTFPTGVTTVTCVARGQRGGRATCGFTVTVNAPSALKVSLEGEGSALEFGPARPVRKAKAVPAGGCACARTVTVENTGCAGLTLDLAAVMRTGSDVDTGKISDPDDSRFFAVTILDADGTERPAICPPGRTGCVRIDAGQKLTFRVAFLPLIPAAFAGKVTRLAASEVLPARLTSQMIFNLSDGTTLSVNLVARVAPEILLVDPEQPRRPARVLFSRTGDQFAVTFAVFDPDLDSQRARYEFIDAQGRAVGEAIEVGLAEAIRAAGIVTGQSFTVTQQFTGARANPQAVRVRVTVFDAHSSDTAEGSIN